MSQETPAPRYCRCYLPLCRLVSPREGVTGRSVVTVVTLARGGCSGKSWPITGCLVSPHSFRRPSSYSCLSKLAFILVGIQILNIPHRHERSLYCWCRDPEGGHPGAQNNSSDQVSCPSCQLSQNQSLLIVPSVIASPVTPHQPGNASGYP